MQNAVWFEVWAVLQQWFLLCVALPEKMEVTK